MIIAARMKLDERFTSVYSTIKGNIVSIGRMSSAGCVLVCHHDLVSKEERNVERVSASIFIIKMLYVFVPYLRHRCPYLSID